MNVIVQFKQTKPFDKQSQEQIDKAIFSQIPQMRVIEENIGTVKKPILVYTRPFQADVKDEAEYQAFLTLLKGFGTVTEIGKWNEDGTKIGYDAKLYKDALNDVKTFETYQDTIIDYDENGVEIGSHKSKDKVREVSSKRPTLAQAKAINCTVFAGRNKREL